MLGAREGVRKAPEDSNGRPPMDVDFGSVQVAEGFQCTIRLRLKGIPEVIAAAVFGHSNGRAQLERHVESGNTRPSIVKLDARNIVKRILAGRHQFGQPVEPPLAARNLQDRLRYQSESTESGDKSKVQRLKVLIERNVQERKPWIGFYSPVGASHSRARPYPRAEGAFTRFIGVLPEAFRTALRNTIRSTLRTRSPDTPSFRATSAVEGNGVSISVFAMTP